MPTARILILAGVVTLAGLVLASGTGRSTTIIRAQSLAECSGETPATSEPTGSDGQGPVLDPPGPTTTPALDEGLIDPTKGGAVEDETGTVKVSFDADDTAEPLKIDIAVAPPCQPFIEGKRVLEQFSLNAFATERADAPVKIFANSVSLEVKFSFEQLMPYAPDSLALYYLNESTGKWEEVEAVAEYGAGRITAELDHFSDFSATAEADVLLSDPLQYFQVDMQSGSATSSIPIVLPSGPGGFTPSLSLLYSSSAVDEMKSKESMASWAGVGWSTTIPTIVRDPYKGRYFLSMAGVSDLLIREDSTSSCPSGLAGTCYEWHTKNDQYLDIHSRICNSNLTADVYHQFLIHTKDGTEYQFGIKPGSSSCPYTYPLGAGDLTPGVDANYPDSLHYFTRLDESSNWHRYHYRMDVSRIKDVNGNLIEYKYWQDVRDDCPSACTKYVRAAYPSEIHWGKNGAQGHQYKVTFARQWDWNLEPPNGIHGYVRRDAPIDSAATCSNYAPHVFETRFLDKITVSTEGGTQIRQYDLDFDNATSPSYGSNNCPVSGNLELHWIDEKGTDPNGAALRRHVFTYADYDIEYRQSGGTLCASAIDDALDRPYLTRIDNGLGGKIDIDYFTDTATKWAKPPSPAICGWERMIVESRTLDDDSGQPDQVYVYSGHSGMTYWSDPTHGVADVDAEYRGFTDVTEKNCTTTSCTTVLGSLECDYSTAGWTTGLTDVCSWKDPGGTTLKEVEYTYSQNATCTTACNEWEGVPSVVVTELEESRFVALKGIQETGAKAAMGDHWTRFEYVSSYGNVTRKCEYTTAPSSAGCPGIPDRDTVTSYTSPNTTAYIVNRPKQKDLENSSGTVVATSRFYYDGSSTLGATPTDGLLTRTDELKTAPSSFITTAQFTYDSYGNIFTSKDGEADTSTFTYDCGNTVVATESLGGLTTTYDYDEPFSSGIDQAGCLFQSPERVADANGVSSYTQYDVYGRVAKEWDELSSESSPTRWFDYDWDQAPIGTIAYQRDGTTDGLWTATWMDGFGRAIQVRKDADTDPGVGQVAVSTIRYDAAGRVAGEGTPKLITSVNPTAYAATTPPDEREYEYDYLGRITKVTNPDPSSTYSTRTYTATGWYEIDENGDKVANTFDSFGRLTEIEEFDGTSITYRYTNYIYNAQDLVKTMQRRDDGYALLAQIDYGYFANGWLQTEDHPDTGETDYTYHDDGLVATRTDARGVVTTYAYDSVGRMTTKSYNDSVTETIYFHYDATPDTYADGLGMPDGYPQGRLTRVREGPEGSGEQAERLFSYDKRGRVVMERHRIASTNYDIEREFDEANRVEVLTYPDGEELTYTYTEQGLVDTVVSSYGVNLVADTTHNPADAVDVRKLGGTAGSPIVVTDLGYRSNDLRLTSIVASGTSGVGLSLTYGYDGEGNVMSIQDNTAFNAVYGFTYDHLDRVTQQTATFGASVNIDAGFVYDRLDNMQTKYSDTSSGTSSFLTGIGSGYLCYGTEGGGCSSGGPHQLTQARGATPGLDNGDLHEYTFTYDSSGNVTEINSPTIANSANSSDIGLLVRYSDQDGDADEAFDGEGRLRYISYDRLERTIYDLAGGCTINIADVLTLKAPFGSADPNPDFDSYFDIAGGDTINIADVLALKPMFGYTCPEYHYDYEGNLSHIKYAGLRMFIGGIYEVDGGVVTKHYFADGARVAERIDGTLYYDAQDHLGSTSAVFEADGDLVTAQRYLPYGETLYNDPAGSEIPGDHTFTSYLEVGPRFAQFQAGPRQYSGVFARFFSPDPLGPSVGDPRTLNPYSYAANNPMRYTDQVGLCFGEAQVPCPENLSAAGAHMIGQFMCCETGRVMSLLTAYSQVGRWGNGNASDIGILWDTYWSGIVLIAGGAQLADLQWSHIQRDLLVSSEYAHLTGLSVSAWPPMGSPEEEALLIGLMSMTVGGGGNAQAVNASSRTLRKNLTEAGYAPQPGSAAHHIVAGNASRAAPARAVLSKYGIDINEASNGVFLPATVHPTIHTNGYYSYVNQQLMNASSREEAIAVLTHIRTQLGTGRIP